MNQIVKTPFLQINSIPININGLIKRTDKIITKKFFSTVEKKYLSFEEIKKRNLHLYVDIRSTKKNKVDIVDNSLDEIIDSLNKIINDKKSENTLFKKLVKNFDENISFYHSDSEITEAFLRKNKYLIN